MTLDELNVPSLVYGNVGAAPLVHVHSGGDITSGTIDGNILPSTSTTKQGAVPLTGTPSGNYLKDDGMWDSPSVECI